MCTVIGCYSGLYSTVPTRWSPQLHGVLSSMIQYCKHITNPIPYCKLWHLVFSTPVHGPHALCVGHNLRWKENSP